jgi:hypothetical protein
MRSLVANVMVIALSEKDSKNAIPALQFPDWSHEQYFMYKAIPDLRIMRRVAALSHGVAMRHNSNRPVNARGDF